MVPKGFGCVVHFHIQLAPSIQGCIMLVIILVSLNMARAKSDGCRPEFVPDGRNQVKALIFVGVRSEAWLEYPEGADVVTCQFKGASCNFMFLAYS